MWKNPELLSILLIIHSTRFIQIQFIGMHGMIEPNFEWIVNIFDRLEKKNVFYLMNCDTCVYSKGSGLPFTKIVLDLAFVY